MWLKSWRSCCSGWWELLRGWRWTGPSTRFWAASSSTTFTSGSVSHSTNIHKSNTHNQGFMLLKKMQKTGLKALHVDLRAFEAALLCSDFDLDVSSQATSTWCLPSSRGSCGTEACQPASAWPLPSRCSLTWSPCSPSTSTASTSMEPGEASAQVQLLVYVQFQDLSGSSTDRKIDGLTPGSSSPHVHNPKLCVCEWVLD